MGEGGMHHWKMDEYGREVVFVTDIGFRFEHALLMTAHMPGVVEVRRAKMNAIIKRCHLYSFVPLATCLVEHIQQIIPLTPFVKALRVLDQA